MFMYFNQAFLKNAESVCDAISIFSKNKFITNKSDFTVLCKIGKKLLTDKEQRTYYL